MHAHDAVWVHAIETLQHAGRRHCTLSPAWHCNICRVHLLQNPPGHVRAPTSGGCHSGALGKKAEGAQLQQSKTMPGLWTHEWHPISFSLVVDNFGVKYIGEKHTQHHLIQTVQKYYTCLFEKEGERYCGLTIKWDYPGKKVPFWCNCMLR